MIFESLLGNPSFSQLGNLRVQVIISFDTVQGRGQNGPLFLEAAVSLWIEAQSGKG